VRGCPASLILVLVTPWLTVAPLSMAASTKARSIALGAGPLP